MQKIKRWALAVYYAIRYGHLEYAPRAYITLSSGKEVEFAVATEHGWCRVKYLLED